MAKINCTVNIQVTEGPKITFTHATEVEAYDRLDVTVPKGGAETEVQVQPGGAGQVSFLLVTSDRYDENISYTVAAGGADAYTLDGPHLLMGAGGVSLLDEAPSSLFFTNADAIADVKVHMLVGRDATP